MGTDPLLVGAAEPSLSLALAALLLFCPPPLQRRDREEIVSTVGRRLRYTNKEIDRAEWLLANLSIVRDAPHAPWPPLQRILVHEGAQELLALLAATAGPDSAALAFCRERLAWPTDRLNPPPLLDGAALIAHGLAPGPEFSSLLEAVRDAQLRGEIHTPAEALALVDRIRAAGP
jgi:hypothetical protein